MFNFVGDVEQLSTTSVASQPHYEWCSRTEAISQTYTGGQKVIMCDNAGRIKVTSRLTREGGGENFRGVPPEISVRKQVLALKSHYDRVSNGGLQTPNTLRHGN